MQSIYLIKNPKVKARTENAHLWCKHTLADVCLINWYEL